MLFAARAADIVLVDILLHLLLGPAVHGALDRNIIFRHIILNQFIRPEALFTRLTVHQRIRKAAQMARSDPGLRIHQDRTVHAHIVRALLHEFLPPGFFYIVLQLHAEVSVIPCIGKPAVNLRSRIYKASRLRQSHYLFHRLFHRLCPPVFCSYLNTINAFPPSGTDAVCASFFSTPSVM